MLQFPKPQRGTHVLDREAARYAIVKAERVAKALAKRRDHWGCRWPDHKCRGPIEVAHVFTAAGMGGDPQLIRTQPENLMTLCSWVHRHGPQSLHSRDLKIEAETPLGTDGPCAFYRRDEHGFWISVGVELAVGVLRKV